MNKTKVLILVIFSLLITVQSTFAQNKPNSSESKNNLVVQDLDLDRKEVIIGCPPGYSSKRAQVCFEKKMEVEVVTVSKIARTKKLTYYYTVSIGKIIGDGARVKWDLSGVKPGTYTITVGVGKNGKIQGNTITKMVVVRDCIECGGDCDCSLVNFKQSKDEVFTGDTISLTAELIGGYQKDTSFKWSISGAEITKGQNTSEITIKIPDDFEKEILTIDLELIDGSCPVCPTDFSKTIKISKKE